MSNFLKPILLKNKVVISVETRKLVEESFHGIVEEKREAIRKLKDIGNNDSYSKFSECTERYLVKFRKELAYDCQKIIQTCEEVLKKDHSTKDLFKGHNELVIKETEGYFIRIAGDFSRYMLECSDVNEEDAPN